MKYYPEVEIKRYQANPHPTVEISTYLRKKHNEKWYKVLVLKKYEIRSDEDNTMSAAISAINMFHREVYLFSILGKIQEGIFSTDGKEVFEIDIDQQEETERLNQLLTI